jgi:hypothetical protein
MEPLRGSRRLAQSSPTAGTGQSQAPQSVAATNTGSIRRTGTGEPNACHQRVRLCSDKARLRLGARFALAEPGTCRAGGPDNRAETSRAHRCCARPTLRRPPPASTLRRRSCFAPRLPAIPPGPGQIGRALLSHFFFPCKIRPVGNAEDRDDAVAPLRGARRHQNWLFLRRPPFRGGSPTSRAGSLGLCC